MSHTAIALLSSHPRIVRIRAPNPGPYTLDGTNTYILGRQHALLIDPGPDNPSHLHALSAWARETDTHIEAVLLTHHHPDHEGNAAAVASAFRAPLISPEEAVQTAQWSLDDGELASVPSPGHTLSDVSFFFPDRRALFTGDTVLGRGTTVITWPEGDMNAYLQTLHSFIALAPRIIYPGHGEPVSDPPAALAHYLAHRLERQEQVRALLGAEPRTSDDIVAAIYPHLAPPLRPLARLTVLAHLHKLVSEGLAAGQGEGPFTATAPRNTNNVS